MAKLFTDNTNFEIFLAACIEVGILSAVAKAFVPSLFFSIYNTFERLHSLKFILCESK